MRNRPRLPCLAFERVLNCPGGAREMLGFFNKGEYWRKHGELRYPCLGFPDIACTPNSAAAYAWRKDRVRIGSSVRLRQEGLNNKDISILHSYNRHLQRFGVMHHNLSYCDRRMCTRDSTFVKDW
eukprot:TRINITY_DN26352_c0_g1_i2.p2 TRINITY_DN26352_c0_g1~~TRINITY_DN26352_c0_g1_i2.p2  ORF type:complete len:125 (+),score=5.56 TRINITY_DN26352_c0_g1_i2:112-486(+)